MKRLVPLGCGASRHHPWFGQAPLSRTQPMASRPRRPGLHPSGIGLILGLLLTFLPLRAWGGEVAVAAASDLVFVLEELNHAFSQTHPESSVRVSTGASGSLFAQLRQGAPFDVFLSADHEFPRELARLGLADTNTLFTYAIGHLVLWTTRTNVPVEQGLSILTNDAIRRVAIANPLTAPYGRAARAALTNAGVWPVVEPRLVIGENIAQTAQFVQTGAVDAGLVGLSLVTAPRLRGVGRWWPVPEATHPRLEQGGILTQRGATNETAKAYLDFLRSPAARVIFDRYGFRPAADPPPAN